ncbi:response regulator transcription factor [Subsaximicrobium wynnwilliamsii]|uniref:Response regulator transcription factor n=1 Tax=Subsaximicrobium wynnwilliamsii TaxID=291179 RepID=A0A5C6ZK58_9FLAO|nr:LytTR family DNA-binding domain-containing protein [Subsaximicrobium wynnwilliamsii]TXD84537.1 response regulator transcription factor [Subsaximicrobium wynnwilliamsii]TXD90219.1 response regulator transcription factor [Subsaximicrobium wynnwilliamsii]TXE04270.1 response regulator transcription factor [Subsaximicrobium wynnwilliamsii]
MSKDQTISCLIVDDEDIAREIIETHLSKIDNIQVVASCSNAIEAFEQISNQQIDLIFLDINMPGISGISFAKSINTHIKIIFTTAYRDYAVEGFELKAVDYLLKPFSFERLKKALDTYFEIYGNTPETERSSDEKSDFIFVRSDRKMIKIDYDSIIFIESYSDYLKMHLDQNTIVTRETITTIEAKLPIQKFLRIHRSYIIAVNHIESFKNERITINNKILPISRTYKKKVLQFLENI